MVWKMYRLAHAESLSQAAVQYSGVQWGRSGSETSGGFAGVAVARSKEARGQWEVVLEELLVGRQWEVALR